MMHGILVFHTSLQPFQGGAAMANDFVTEASLREPEAINAAKFHAALAPTVGELKKYRISKRESQENSGAALA
jgi:hypothetical protein